jgi:hypothetical protein
MARDEDRYCEGDDEREPEEQTEPSAIEERNSPVTGGAHGVPEKVDEENGAVRAWGRTEENELCLEPHGLGEQHA